ncbi:hypothetical protein D0T49_03660 [Paludibacter sp. 221]|uniref:hypothetical protein n=1 Tax=Paludibacter sp. 221 TaxID=2302939 RepID=UPI0013D499AA|nr:hypothetical protein [Paludibacter sp. 221]NDV46137.1 hypothetical protein [Paludibacter sp. 221]
METTINQRISIISEKLCDNNISELARITGVNQPALRDIVGKKQAKPRYEILNRIVDNSTLNINADWLLTGRGEMLNTQQKAKPYKTKKEQKTIIINSTDEWEVNNKITEMNNNGWNAINTSISEAGLQSGGVQRHTVILFEKYDSFNTTSIVASPVPEYNKIDGNNQDELINELRKEIKSLEQDKLDLKQDKKILQQDKEILNRELENKQKTIDRLSAVKENDFIENAKKGATYKDRLRK